MDKILLVLLGVAIGYSQHDYIEEVVSKETPPPIGLEEA